MKIDDKTLLITGASQGLGRFLASRWAAKTSQIIGLARSQQGLAETGRLVEAAGGQWLGICCDLRDPHAVEAAATRVLQAGNAEIVIHNAADVTSLPLLDTTWEAMDSLVRANVLGPLYLTRLLAPELLQREQALIVFISSLAGCKPNPSQTVYSITKRAVNGMADALRAEFQNTPIRVMNALLSSVGERNGQVAPEHYATLLERAIGRNADELYLSWQSTALMRLYGAFPFLARR